MERVVVTTGGTGGHIFPALAVAEELRQACPGVEILFLGAQYGQEKHLAERAGLQFIGLPVRGILGRGIKAVGAAIAMCGALFQAHKILKDFRPDIVAGFGGYAAFAPVLAARLLHIPCLLHEQNAIPGSSNKVLGRLVQKICLSLPVSHGFPSEKCVLTGNPVRHSVALLHKLVRERGRRHLLIMGGSLGAHALNECIVSILPFLKEAGVDLLHQTGEKDAASVRAAYTRAGYAATCVHAFIDNMAEAYAWADLVFCRSGATTVAELAAAGLPAVVVPFPFAIHDHQTCNARSMVECGAAMMVAEKDLSHMDIGSILLQMLADEATLIRMGEAARAQARIDAAAAVVREMHSLVRTSQ